MTRTLKTEAPRPPVAPQVLVCLTTAPDEQTAARIARTLAEERLTACATLLPARSIYRWKDKIEESREVQCLFKTTAECLPALMERLRTLHPYELPEILALEVQGGLEPYLDWVAAGVTPA